MTTTTNRRRLQHLGTPLRPRQARWIMGCGDLTATWFCYDPRGRLGIVYARPYRDARACVRWRLSPKIPHDYPPTADEQAAAHEVRQRLQQQAQRARHEGRNTGAGAELCSK